MSGKYAAKTVTSSASSRDEIERTLRRYGASEFAYGWNHNSASIGFSVAGRFVRVVLPMPDAMSDEFRFTPERRIERDDSARAAAFEQATRQRWRALVLVIKAKLEAVEAGISTVEREFLADVQMPNGRTVGEWVAPAIEQAYQTERMPAITAGGS